MQEPRFLHLLAQSSKLWCLLAFGLTLHAPCCYFLVHVSRYCEIVCHHTPCYCVSLHTSTACAHVFSNSWYRLSFSFHFVTPRPMLWSSMMFFHICHPRNLYVKCPHPSYCVLLAPLPFCPVSAGRCAGPASNSGAQQVMVPLGCDTLVHMWGDRTVEANFSWGTASFSASPLPQWAPQGGFLLCLWNTVDRWWWGFSGRSWGVAEQLKLPPPGSGSSSHSCCGWLASELHCFSAEKAMTGAAPELAPWASAPYSCHGPIGDLD